MRALWHLSQHRGSRSGLLYVASAKGHEDALPRLSLRRRRVGSRAMGAGPGVSTEGRQHFTLLARQSATEGQADDERTSRRRLLLDPNRTLRGRCWMMIESRPDARAVRRALGLRKSTRGTAAPPPHLPSRVLVDPPGDLGLGLHQALHWREALARVGEPHVLASGGIVGEAGNKKQLDHCSTRIVSMARPCGPAIGRALPFRFLLFCRRRRSVCPPADVTDRRRSRRQGSNRS